MYSLGIDVAKNKLDVCLLNPENDQRRAQDKLQELTNKYIGELDHVGAAKEAEVMEV